MLKQLKANGEAFKLVSTLLTKTIITETDIFYSVSSDSNLKLNELALIKSVKDYVIKNNIKAIAQRKNIRYIDKAILKNATFKNDLYEIDLKSAYWNYAYKFKFISKDIYERGNDTNKISKKARLIALGNLAKRSYEMEFNGSEFGKSEIIESDNTQDIFFKVSQKTDSVMTRLKLIAAKDYLFYWVDAVFVKSERAKNEIENYLKQNRIEFKTVKIDKILKTNGYIKVWDKAHKKPRPFMFESLKTVDLTSVID